MIETERLVLRDLTFADAKDIYDMLAEEGVARWVGIKPISSVEEAWAFVKRCMDSFFIDIYGITEKGSDKVIGIVQIVDRWFRRKSLGYCLAAAYRGKGYMTEAVLAVEKELFEAGMHRLTICCDVNNYASSNVAVRAGYKLESIAKEATYHPTGLHNLATYVKFSPFPPKGF